MEKFIFLIMVFFDNNLNSCDFLKKMSDVVFHSSIINSFAVDICKIIKKKIVILLIISFFLLHFLAS